MLDAFRTGRDETWYVRKVQSWATIEQARQYVRDQSRIHTELPRFLISLASEEEKARFIEEFCFDNPLYLSYRRLFVGWVYKESVGSGGHSGTLVWVTTLPLASDVFPTTPMGVSSVRGGRRW